MRIVSFLEDHTVEKRIAITPDVAKKYIALGFELSLQENYGVHLGINDDVFKDIGATIFKDEKKIIDNLDLVIQLGLLSADRLSLLKENQIIVGVLNPFKNKDKNTYPGLRLIISAIKDSEIANRTKDKKELSDSDIMAILKKMIKQRNESCEVYKKAGRQELLNTEQKEI